MKVDIKHLAKLARLKTTKEEEEKYEKQMESIIDMVEKLPLISKEDSLVDPSNPMKCREDVVSNDYKRDDLLKNAPEIKAGCVVVPKVIE